MFYVETKREKSLCAWYVLKCILILNSFIYLMILRVKDMFSQKKALITTKSRSNVSEEKYNIKESIWV